MKDTISFNTIYDPHQHSFRKVNSLRLSQIEIQKSQRQQSMAILNSARTDTNSSIQQDLNSARDGIELVHSRRLQREQQLSRHYQRLDTITNSSKDLLSSSRQISQLKRSQSLPRQQTTNGNGFIPKYFYSFQTTMKSIDFGDENDEAFTENGEEAVKSVRFIDVLLNLMQEFTTSNFFVLPFAFYQGGFLYSNIFLFVSFLLTAFPMIILVDLKRLTNLTLRELCYLRWGYVGKLVADICVFFTHFSDLYSYIQALTIMVMTFCDFFSLTVSQEHIFWIQIALIFPMMSIPQYTNRISVRYVCDAFMAVGFGISIYLNTQLISFKDISTYSYTRSTNVMQSAMNMFSCFEESISVYEVYKDGMTVKQLKRFKIHVWIAHFILYILSLALCNLTWLAFGDDTKQNVMQMYDDKQVIVFIAKVFFILAAVPAYSHLFSPMDVMNKDCFGIYSENNRLAIFRLDMFDQQQMVYFPRRSEASGIRWFKLCYFHQQEVQVQMEQLNKDSQSVKVNKKVMFYLTKFAIVYFSIFFGMLTSDFSNAIFNICQVFFKTPISLILPCHLHLVYGNLSQVEKVFNVVTIIIGYSLTFTSFLYLF